VKVGPHKVVLSRRRLKIAPIVDYIARHSAVVSAHERDVARICFRQGEISRQLLHSFGRVEFVLNPYRTPSAGYAHVYTGTALAC